MAYRQNNSQGRNDRVRFDLMERIGVLSRKDTGWTREVNIVSWNDGPGKVDIREWDPDHKRMTKGITLFEDEAERLAKVLARRYGLSFAGSGQNRGRSFGERAAAPAGRRYIVEKDEDADRSFFGADENSAAGSSLYGAEESAAADSSLYGSEENSAADSSLYGSEENSAAGSSLYGSDDNNSDDSPLYETEHSEAACVAEGPGQMDAAAQA